MTVEEIYKNRDKFSQEVQRVASQDLAKMGLIIVSFTIKDVRDKNGYLDSLRETKNCTSKTRCRYCNSRSRKRNTY